MKVKFTVYMKFFVPESGGRVEMDKIQVYTVRDRIAISSNVGPLGFLNSTGKLALYQHELE